MRHVREQYCQRLVALAGAKTWQSGPAQYRLCRLAPALLLSINSVLGQLYARSLPPLGKPWPVSQIRLRIHA